jgi:hypothetical protein
VSLETAFDEHAFYWIWADLRGPYEKEPRLRLIVASPWLYRGNPNQPGYPKWMWEACGTDEGVVPIKVLERIIPPTTLPPNTEQGDT